MTTADRERLRVTFTEDAGLYDRVRPGYPPGLFDDLATLAGVGPGCRVCEIGCGTGQATVPLAQRGCEILAVELGEEMAALARRRLAGTLVTIATHHIAGGTAEFFEAAQDCYLRFDPSTVPGFDLPSAAAVPRASEDLEASGRFGPAVFRRYEWEAQ